MAELAERAPDGLVNAERVRVLHERGEEQVERFLRLPAGGEMARQREPRAPVLRVVFDEPPAESREALRAPARGRPALRADRRPDRRDPARPARASPRSPAASFSLPCGDAHVAEVQVGRHGARVEIDGALEAAARLGVVLAAHRLEADLVLEERENGLALRLASRWRPAWSAAAACRTPRSTGAALRAASAG